MGWVKNEEVNKLFDKKKEKGQPSIHQIVTFYLLKLGEISVEKKKHFLLAIAQLPKCPPPMTPIQATWSFGRQNSRLERFKQTAQS